MPSVRLLNPTPFSSRVNLAHEILQRAPEAVEPPDDQGISTTELLEAPLKLRPMLRGPRRLLLVDLLAARFFQGVQLQVEFLLAGRDPGVSDVHGEIWLYLWGSYQRPSQNPLRRYDTAGLDTTYETPLPSLSALGDQDPATIRVFAIHTPLGYDKRPLSLACHHGLDFTFLSGVPITLDDPSMRWDSLACCAKLLLKLKPK